MEKPPKISVVLPVYNCELYIKEAVDSILNQTFSDFELLIIDDCSNDNTVDLIKEYNDERIKLTLKEKNSGYTESLNWAISIAKGEYIARMDGDDISMPTRFEKQIKVMEENPKIIVCGTNGKVLGSERLMIRPEKHQDIYLFMFISNPIIHPSIMIRKTVFKTFSYNKSTEPSEDYDLWSRLIFEGEFYNIQKTLLQYRMHQTNVSKLNSINQTNNFELSRIKFFERFNFFESKKTLLIKCFIGSNIITANDFKELITYFQSIAKKQKITTEIDYLSNILINRFFNQNKISKNIKYFNYLTFKQIIQTVRFYFNKKMSR